MKKYYGKKIAEKRRHINALRRVINWETASGEKCQNLHVYIRHVTDIERFLHEIEVYKSLIRDEEK